MTSEEINIYCDESCHLEHEPEHVMLISCIYCPKDKVQQISMDLRALKENFGLSKRAELKWHKISKNKKIIITNLLTTLLITMILILEL